MSDQPAPKPTRRTTAILVGVLLAVIIVVTVVGLITAAALPPSSPKTASGVPATTYSAAPTTTTTPSASPTSSTATATPKASATTAPTPQATRSAPIAESTPATISKELSVRVIKMEAVTGTADGPGEIAGPSVRFTIRIENTTGRSVNLSNTVVNAYYGVNATPAIALDSPGGKAFPSTVADGGTATGVFVFNIPKSSRGNVQVTVDTSVNNPVIAFKGAAPTS